jgi:hypothetical protein
MSSSLMLPTHGIAKNPFRFSISDKKLSDNCESTFLDLPGSYLRYLNRGLAPDGRGVQRRPRRFKTLAHVRLYRCKESITSIMIAHAIAIFCAQDHPIKVRSKDPGSQRSHPILRRFRMDSSMPFCYKGYIP